MFIWYDYDPSIHRLHPVPVLATLRRELKTDKVVIYHHQVHDTWVVSFKVGGKMCDIGLLGTGEGEGPWTTRENRQAIVLSIVTRIRKEEARKRLRRWAADNLRKDAAAQASYLTGLSKARARIKNRHGEQKAREFSIAAVGSSTIPDPGA